MGLFNRLKRKKKEKAEQEGGVFLFRLLMKEECKMPQKDEMTRIMQKHLGEVNCFSHDGKVAGFAAEKYKVEFKEGAMPPQLMVMECAKTDGYEVTEMERSQMWNCEDSEEILSECKYQVVATDLLGSAMDYKERAEMLMDYVEALVELYPDCVAVHFNTSGKLVTREQIVNHQIPRENRFLSFAVNVRSFHIQGTEDMMVDSLGMSALRLPDVQYHFHGMEADAVVNHAYNLLSYLFDEECPVESGEKIDGLANGLLSQEVQWKCQYEESLIQPLRPVLDVNMGEYAAGGR